MVTARRGAVLNSFFFFTLPPALVRTKDERERHTPACGLAQGMEKKTVGEKEKVCV